MAHVACGDYHIAVVTRDGAHDSAECCTTTADVEILLVQGIP